MPKKQLTPTTLKRLTEYADFDWENSIEGLSALIKTVYEDDYKAAANDFNAFMVGNMSAKDWFDNRVSPETLHYFFTLCQDDLQSAFSVDFLMTVFEPTCQDYPIGMLLMYGLDPMDLPAYHTRIANDPPSIACLQNARRAFLLNWMGVIIMNTVDNAHTYPDIDEMFPNRT